LGAVKVGELALVSDKITLTPDCCNQVTVTVSSSVTVKFNVTDEGASVTLNLTVTDDDTVTVTWLQQSGVSVILSDTSANSPTF
ncbi:hypothetical protein H4J50_19340, partial [Colwellia sp. 6M3]|uniref:hypothetical protein n=1 Tax=Colwellia sp. 6M3 TaxID=2759849 RepID=UPI0015F743AE